MDDFYNKHYVRLDANGNVVKGFSDAFEEPKTGDICINETHCVAALMKLYQAKINNA